MEKKRTGHQGFSVPDLTEEELKELMKRPPQIHAERRKLTPEEEEHWAKVRARIKEMREKGEI